MIHFSQERLAELKTGPATAFLGSSIHVHVYTYMCFLKLFSLRLIAQIQPLVAQMQDVHGHLTGALSEATVQPEIFTKTLGNYSDRYVHHLSYSIPSLALCPILRQKRDDVMGFYVKCTKLDVAMNGMLVRAKCLDFLCMIYGKYPVQFPPLPAIWSKALLLRSMKAVTPASESSRPSRTPKAKADPKGAKTKRKATPKSEANPKAKAKLARRKSRSKGSKPDPEKET